MNNYPYTPSEDQLQDDLTVIMNSKAAFIVELDNAAKRIGIDADTLIDIEQRIDDALFDSHRKLTSQLGVCEPLPVSKRYQEWLRKTMSNRIVTNPATFSALGVAI